MGRLGDGEALDAMGPEGFVEALVGVGGFEEALGEVSVTAQE